MNITDFENRRTLLDTSKTDEIIKTFTKNLRESIKKAEKIVIFGDYDCDGILSSKILKEYAASINPRVTVVIGSREDGYGIPKNYANYLGDGTLVICTDIGSSEPEVTRAMEQITGLTPVVIDHHEIVDGKNSFYESLQADRKAYFLNLPEADYCATGYARMIAELDEEFQPDSETAKEILVCGCIGTIADMAAVNNPYDQNRKIILDGFEVMRDCDSVRGVIGEILKEKNMMREYVTTADIGFNIAPIFNAYSRLESNGGQKTFDIINYDENDKLFDGKYCSISTIFDYIEGAKLLIAKNEERKDAFKEIINSDKYTAFKEAIQHGESRIAIYRDDTLPRGLIGLVAQDLAKTLGVPAIVFTASSPEANSSMKDLVCSARNVDGFPDMLNSCKSPLIKIGGHASAFGGQMKSVNFDTYKEDMTARYSLISVKEVSYDCLTDLEGITKERLYAMEPFGQDLPAPKIDIRATISGKTSFAKNENWAKFTSVEYPDITFLSWENGQEIKSNLTLRVRGSLGLNTYRSPRTDRYSTSLQVTVSDIESIKTRNMEKGYYAR